LPETLRKEFVISIHALPINGHQSNAKTAERVNRDYYFPRLQKIMKTVINECYMCHTSKSDRHMPYSKLQPNEAPRRKWQIIIMDFIIKLSLSKDLLTGVKYDSILVIVNRLIKYVYFVSYLKGATAE